MNAELNQTIRESVINQDVEKVKQLYKNEECKREIDGNNLFVKYFVAKCQIEGEEKREKKLEDIVKDLKDSKVFEFFFTNPNVDVKKIPDNIKEDLKRDEKNTEAMLDRIIKKRLELYSEHYGIITQSEKMLEVFEIIDRVKNDDSTILILGESGTGKELIAKAIHEKGSRAGKPFIPVNLVSLSENLIESELFGYEKGAYTGADQQKKGRFEQADGGTLFLDEIGEIPMDTQVKLLRVLQERNFERVGGTETVKVDVRLISATNRNLEAAMREGSFREDLYYRLNVIGIDMPPLRERGNDIQLLADYFVQFFSKGNKRLSEEAKERLTSYHWPGNVRELRNLIERASLLGSECITAKEMGKFLKTPPDDSRTKELSLRHRGEYQSIKEAFEKAKGKITKAAKMYGCTPTTFRKKAREHGLM